MSTGTHNGQFPAPGWLRTMGFSSWLLVGFVSIILGVIWLLGRRRRSSCR